MEAINSTAPEWVRVGQELMMNQCRAYREETGRPPSRELLAEFQRAGRAAAERFIADPVGQPYRPMTLTEFERRDRKWHGSC